MQRAVDPGQVNPAARLGATKGAQRVPTRDLELYVVRHFLDPAGCAALIVAILLVALIPAHLARRTPIATVLRRD